MARPALQYRTPLHQARHAAAEAPSAEEARIDESAGAHRPGTASFFRVRLQELHHGLYELLRQARPEMVGVWNHLDAQVLHDAPQLVHRWFLGVVFSHGHQRWNCVVPQALFRDFEITVGTDDRRQARADLVLLMKC